MTAIATETRSKKIDGLPFYLYLNFDGRFTGANKYFIPGWLRAKTQKNSLTQGKPKTVVDNCQLFEQEVVDATTLLVDLAAAGYKPSHIHMMNRDKAAVRVRITFMNTESCDVLSAEETQWVTNVINRFYFDAMAYKQYTGTEHLPPHVNTNLGRPVGRDNATSVFSIQLMDDEVVCLNDPS